MKPAGHIAARIICGTLGMGAVPAADAKKFEETPRIACRSA
ncbi:MAG TPA: hypothetical protein VHD36_06315 [Pirellulales bacterium]|nr:hypothetical protein [Pirellulales bacterium]